MAIFTSLDTRLVTLTGGVDSIDPSNRGGCSFVLKNTNAAGGNKMYVGPAVDRAGNALSATNGYPLSGGESLSINYDEPTGAQAQSKLSVIGTATEKLAVFVLMP